MLQPKRLKWRRSHLIRPKRQASRGNTIAYGQYGLEATRGGYISNRQIEAARIVLSRYTRKIGKNFIRIYPDIGITKKPAGVRMGNGKGTVEGWFAVVQKGQILFEVSGVEEVVAREALNQAGYKLSVTTRVVKKEEVK